MLFVVTGPSGCGKSTLIRRTLSEVEGLRFSISHTTRPRRSTEVNGRDYYFVSSAEFEKMVSAGAFLEWAVVHGQKYGTSRAEVNGKSATADLILDIDVQGARQVKDQRVKAVFVFVVPARFEDLRERLERRGQDDPDTIRRRLATAVTEVEAIPEFDDLVINDDLDRAVEDLKAIVRAERCRVGARWVEAEAVLKSFRAARTE